MDKWKLLKKDRKVWTKEALKDEAKLELDVAKLQEEEVKQIDDKWNNCVKAQKVKTEKEEREKGKSLSPIYVLKSYMVCADRAQLSSVTTDLSQLDLKPSII